MPPATHEWIDTALAYTQLGWELVPLYPTGDKGRCTCDERHCPGPGRHPRFQHWQDEKSAAERDVRSWGDIWTDADVAVVGGLSSDLAVLEVSSPEGGTDTLHRLLEEHGPLPETPHATHGGTRTRYFFRHPGAEIGQSADLGPGLRLLGANELIPLPRSPFRNRRSFYRWKVGPGLEEVAGVPSWVLEKAGIEPEAEAPPIHTALPSSPASSLPFSVPEAATLSALAETRWIVRPWLAEGSLALVTGSPKAGKSRLLLGLTRSALTGASFLGERSQQSPVVYLTEQSPSTFSKGLIEAGITGALPLSQLHILYAEQVEDVAWPALLAEAASHCEAVGARLLVVDSLNRFAGMSPGSTSDEAELVRPLVDVVKKQISVAAVCQLRSQMTSLSEEVHQLGTLASTADTVISVSKVHGSGNLRRIETLSRFKETPDKEALRLKDTEYRRAKAAPTLFDRPRAPVQTPPAAHFRTFN